MDDYTYSHGDGTSTNLKETVQKLLKQLKDGGLTYGEAQCALNLATRDLEKEVKNYLLMPYEKAKRELWEEITRSLQAQTRSGQPFR